MKSIEEKKAIFVSIIKEFQYSDDNSKIIVWDVIVRYLSNDDEEIIEKVYNLLKLLNEVKQKSEEEFKTFMDRDIENDIWYNV